MIRDNDHRAPLISSAVARLMHCVTPLRQLEEVEAAVASAQRDLGNSGRVELDARYLNRELPRGAAARRRAQRTGDRAETTRRDRFCRPGETCTRCQAADRPRGVLCSRELTLRRLLPQQIPSQLVHAELARRAAARPGKPVTRARVA